MNYESPDQIHSVFAEAFAAGDVDALLDLYEDGAVQLQRDGSVLSGRDNLRAVFTQLLSLGLTMSGKQQHAIVAGDLALTSTRYELPTSDGAGMTTMSTAEVSHRQPDGTWRIVIDAPSFA
jgi:uncharacterized protein (TIGR02246 family)